MEYIALDVHKKYTWARVENPKGDRLYERRLAQAHGTIKNFLSDGAPALLWPWRQWVTGTGGR
jgi:hypothetical protein